MDTNQGKTLLVLGGSGLVGMALLNQALANPAVARVVAPTRQPLAAALTKHPKLNNPLVDFDALPQDTTWWHADAVLCTLGTTLRQAGSKTAFRAVDYGLVTRCARHALSAGSDTWVLTSSLGANAQASSFYLQVKGETEAALRAMGFGSLTVVRPSLLKGKREESRLGESIGLLLAGLLNPVIPKRYRAVAAEDVAATMLNAALDPLEGYRVIQSAQIPAQP